jgi:two-component system, OmpR family, response regulator
MRVLLVEDEDVLAKFLCISFRHEGYVVDCVVDGISALNKIKSKQYDLIILDVILPQKNGLDVCRETRQYGVVTPILILSSQNTDFARVKGLDAGADDYVAKPFSYTELQARIRALHRRPSVIADDMVVLGDLSISAAFRKVWMSNKEVKLRNKEFLLLDFLVRKNGRVATRDELLEHVWGIGIGSASNRVDACIKELRSKLGRDQISTIHGVGYTMRVSKEE